MENFLSGHGFLGTQAPLRSDLTLLLILLSAALLTTGWRLAVAKNFKVHRWVQTGAVVLNTLVVLSVMIPSFIKYILPGVPGKLHQSAYAVPAIHGTVGLIGVLLGVYIVLAANKVLPERLRFKNYKLFMRTSYGIYMLATLGGVIVYIITYVTPA